jgi:5-methylcytosine-specific restriction protein A
MKGKRGRDSAIMQITEVQMSVKKLTTTAVRQAIAEFDRLGREKFLDRYGFAEAREYFLMYKGRAYDSKAIVGVAHKFLRNGRALSSQEFSGGISGAAAELEKLGFVVQAGSLAA